MKNNNDVNKEFIKKLQKIKIQLLVSEDDVNNYNKIKSGLDRLRVLVEQSELWIYKKKDASAHSKDLAAHETIKMNAEDQQSNAKAYIKRLFEKSSIEISKKEMRVLEEFESTGPEIEKSAILKYQELYKILHDMIRLCANDENLPNGQVIKKPRKNDQRLLKNMGVHNIVLDLTKISYEKKEDKRMRIIMRTAHEFLQNFCYQNPHNQILLHERIDLTNFPSNEWEAATATYIFKDNTTLCNDISERLIQNCIHEIENQNSLDESKVSYLEFLQTVCVVEEVEIKKNQDLIIDELVNSEVLSYWTEKLNADELCSLMQNEFDKFKKISIKNPLILFHINMIKLLINCTVGKNTFTEIKCHTIVSIDDIEKVVTNKKCLIEIKDIYMKYLYHCHIDTENETKEIFTRPFIWSLFESFVQDINYYLLNSTYSTERLSNRLLESYVSENIIQIIIGFFSHNQFNHLQSPHVIFNIRFWILAVF